MKSVLFILPLLALVGCKPAKAPIVSSFPEGFQHTVGPGNLEKIVYSGDVSVDAATAQQNVLKRTVEIAQEKNKKYLFMYDSLNGAAIGRLAEQPTVGTIGGMSTAFIFVRFLDGPEKGAHDVAKLLKQKPAAKPSQTKPKK